MRACLWLGPQRLGTPRRADSCLTVPPCCTCPKCGTPPPNRGEEENPKDQAWIGNTGNKPIKVHFKTLAECVRD